MKGIRKISGVLCIILGACGILLNLIMAAVLALEMIRWGSGRTEMRMAVFYLGVFLISGAVFFLGIRLMNSTSEGKFRSDRSGQRQLKQKIKDEQMSDLWVKEENSRFEGTEVSDYVPDAGVYIWRYAGGRPSGRRFLKYRYLYYFILVAAVFISMSAFVYLSFRLEGKIDETLSLAAVVIFTLLLVFGVQRIGTKSQGMLYVFVRDKRRCLYMVDFSQPEFQKYRKLHSGTGEGQWFDYLFNSAQEARLLREIEQNGVIERLISLEKQGLYAFRITRVEKIRRMVFSVRVYYQFERYDGRTGSRSIVIPRSFHNFDELVRELERLQ